MLCLTEAGRPEQNGAWREGDLDVERVRSGLKSARLTIRGGVRPNNHLRQAGVAFGWSSVIWPILFKAYRRQGLSAPQRGKPHNPYRGCARHRPLTFEALPIRPPGPEKIDNEYGMV
jgi:hypothetical protein